MIIILVLLIIIVINKDDNNNNNGVEIFMKTIGESIALKWDKVACLQESISFVILRLSILCLRGSCTK